MQGTLTPPTALDLGRPKARGWVYQPDELNAPAIPVAEDGAAPEPLANLATERMLAERQLQPVDDPLAWPWCSVVRVTVTWATGSVQGSGFVIARDRVLTCAHLITALDADRSVLVEFVSGDQTWANYAIYPPWRVNNARGYDIALLTLPTELPASCPPFQLEPFPDESFAAIIEGGYPAHVPGFPTDQAPAMMESVGPLASAGATQILHRAHTQSGQSGAPLLYVTDSGSWPMAVHGYNAPAPDSAARITPQVMNWIAKLA